MPSGESHIDYIGVSSETQSHEKNIPERTQSERNPPGRPLSGETHDQVQHELRKGHHIISTATYYRAERRGTGVFQSGGSYVPADGGADTGDETYDE